MSSHLVRDLYLTHQIQKIAKFGDNYFYTGKNTDGIHYLLLDEIEGGRYGSIDLCHLTRKYV